MGLFIQQPKNKVPITLAWGRLIIYVVYGYGQFLLITYVVNFFPKLPMQSKNWVNSKL